MQINFCVEMYSWTYGKNFILLLEILENEASEKLM